MTGHLCVLACGLRRTPAAFDALREAPQIALERVEIDDQGRGVDLIEAHADFGGRARRHRWVLRLSSKG
jgi:hypothetical protein